MSEILLIFVFSVQRVSHQMRRWFTIRLSRTPDFSTSVDREWRRLVECYLPDGDAVTDLMEADSGDIQCPGEERFRSVCMGEAHHRSDTCYKLVRWHKGIDTNSIRILSPPANMMCPCMYVGMAFRCALRDVIQLQYRYRLAMP